MNQLMKEILHARPTLRMVSPLSNAIVLILGIFNLILGAVLFFGLDTSRLSAPLLIVNEVFTFQLWGIAFFILGLVKLYSLYSNNWWLARKSLFVGVAMKAAWAVALTIRAFISPGTFLLNLIWLTIAFMQMATYIFFMPPSTSEYEQRRIDRE